MEEKTYTQSEVDKLIGRIKKASSFTRFKLIMHISWMFGICAIAVILTEAIISIVTGVVNWSSIVQNIFVALASFLAGFGSAHSQQKADEDKANS